MIRVFRHHVAEFWCKTMHSSPMWPSHGHYRCRTCGREYAVPWEFDLRKAPSQNKTARLRADAQPLIGSAIAR